MFLLPISITFHYLDQTFANRMSSSMCQNPSGTRLGSWFRAILYHITGLTALCPGLPGWAGTRKVKPIWILMEQETVSGSGISRAICKSAPRSRQITTPAPHHSVFLQAGCPSCRPTNSVKALKAHVHRIFKWPRFWATFWTTFCRKFGTKLCPSCHDRCSRNRCRRLFLCSPWIVDHWQTW